VNDTCSPSLLFQGTGKENLNPSFSSRTLNDISGATSIWADSPRNKFDKHGPKKPTLGSNALSLEVPGIPHSPPLVCMPQPSTRSQGRPKGLLGWGDTSHLRSPVLVPSVLLRQHQPESPSRNPGLDRVLDPPPPTLDPTSPLPKRRRLSRLSQTSLGIKSESSSGSFDSSDEDASRDDDDSDDYRPSPSLSPKLDRFKTEPSAESTLPLKPAIRLLKRRKTTKEKRAKKKGSAALALAVVTQIGEAKREAKNLQVPLDPTSYDPVRVYHEGSCVVRKRKNQPIPVPVPVPNLNKKSRGRKVPNVSNYVSPEPSSTLDVASSPVVEYGFGTQPRKPTRSRNKTVSTSEESGARTYVCVVAGCGKCFVRGEHLKRHVRSIHTNDKRKSHECQSYGWLLIVPFIAHVCPIEGCDKSFSRRDNLGQHVRVHLQS
jgi:hypothetical protein